MEQGQDETFFDALNIPNERVSELGKQVEVALRRHSTFSGAFKDLYYDPDFTHYEKMAMAIIFGYFMAEQEQREARMQKIGAFIRALHKFEEGEN